MNTFKLGNWYESIRQVRTLYREYWKGILCRNGDIAIIFEYKGSRRVHYGDRLDYHKGQITYVGEGKSGDQKLTPRNQALITACETGREIKLFMDCGDVFKPKRLLYAGKWMVVGNAYTRLPEDPTRSVFQFTLEPSNKERAQILNFLSFSFDTVGVNLHKSEHIAQRDRKISHSVTGNIAHLDRLISHS